MRSAVLFCRVIDNFGDIGVCWRLARLLQHAYGWQVSIWVDDLASFARLCPGLDVQASHQAYESIQVVHWCDQMPAAEWRQLQANLLIEGFGCRLPDAALERIAQLRPHWINLEYLSAESWVESCHGLRSPDAQTGLSKYFFFPGFSAKTGGVLYEPGLDAERRAFRRQAALRTQFVQSLHLPLPVQQALDDPAYLKVLMFCYPQSGLSALIQAWQEGAQELLCLLPQGVATAQAQAFLGGEAQAGAWRRQGNLTLAILPFVPQARFDRLLWLADMAFVRGEDSFVRAQLAGLPLVWQIYPQEADAHLEKLEAFMQAYLARLQPPAAHALQALWQVWNQPEHYAGLGAAWRQLQASLPQLHRHALRWRQRLRRNGDLAGNLLQFIQKIG
ncbi:elongation factor P maturation arginine rhamnosyltransferase EarP [Massilia sp. W12]|uniref:elongation factor P maturation arginine rhamnosyltransferase EarP n=1 Tax=Massilia sp. W12 TaxID=3126507 RepID=UPI0030CD00E8